MNLHDEVDTYEIKWMARALLHAMIDLGYITELKCQHPNCDIPDTPFTKKNARGSRTALSFDHIVGQRHGGSDRIENLRLAHSVCNMTWRRGELGSFHKPETSEILSALAKKQHENGRAQDYSDPVRNGKISIAMTGKTDHAYKGWETRRARMNGGE